MRVGSESRAQTASRSGSIGRPRRSIRPGWSRRPRSLGLDPVPLDRIQGAVSDALDRVFGLFDVLSLVAVVVASLGIVNTLTMSVLERVREIGVLRAAGMTRRQVWRSVVVEAGVTGLAGAISGVVTGMVVSGLLIVLSGGRLEPAAPCRGWRWASPSCWG